MGKDHQVGGGYQNDPLPIGVDLCRFSVSSFQGMVSKDYILEWLSYFIYLFSAPKDILHLQKLFKLSDISIYT